MAAYGALLSVLHIIDQIQLHPHPPISLDKTQVQSLVDHVTFLQEYLEGYYPDFGYNKESDPLEMRIADAAYATEDVIESHIVDQVLAREKMSSNKIGFFNFFIQCFQGLRKAATDHEDGVSPTDRFYQSLQKVIEDMDSLNKEVTEIREKTGARDQLMSNSMPARSLRYPSAGQNLTMVGFDDISVELMDKLTGGHRDRQVIPIVGMGGTGKTTLAKHIYENQVVVQHFDIRAWVTISQVYSMREILIELLQEGGRDRSQMNEYELRDELHKKLFRRRYMIVMDDIWDIEVWDQLKRYFPDDKNGSRIVITTRISNFEFTGCYVFQMGFLDEDKSWDLFTKIVFGEEDCPFELVEIGKKIVENCRGLPLSIVVVGGLLAKSKNAREYWESIVENLNSIVNSEDDESCLKILHMSYNQLPVYLKPCFLYMGVFSEDKEIRVSELIKLWVGEGFLKPVSDRSLEDVAEEYLHELINRNMVLAHKLGSIGNVKYCKIHDLLRDLCLRQAEKDRFYSVTRQCSPDVRQDTGKQRRFVIPKHTSENEVLSAFQTMSYARSLINDFKEVPPLNNFRLLRIMSGSHSKPRDFREDMFKIVNSRCLLFKYSFNLVFPSSYYPHWNLQTLVIEKVDTAPFEIWSMPLLRHVECGQALVLADLRRGKQDGIVLRNLQTLGRVENFKCCEEVVKRIPNIKKLKIRYERRESKKGWRGYGFNNRESKKGRRDYCVNNFIHLHKLESLDIHQSDNTGVWNLTFPHSLRKLSLWIYFHCEDMFEQIGSLPLLEKFTLQYMEFKENKWETSEGRFPSLKFLQIMWCRSLQYWKTESSHFPRLVLVGLEMLEEIPSEIGDIPTLKKIHVKYCSNSAAVSAKRNYVGK